MPLSEVRAELCILWRCHEFVMFPIGKWPINHNLGCITCDLWLPSLLGKLKQHGVIKELVDWHVLAWLLEVSTRRNVLQFSRAYQKWRCYYYDNSVWIKYSKTYIHIVPTLNPSIAGYKNQTFIYIYIYYTYISTYTIYIYICWPSIPVPSSLSQPKFTNQTNQRLITPRPRSSPFAGASSAWTRAPDAELAPVPRGASAQSSKAPANMTYSPRRSGDWFGKSYTFNIYIYT